MTMLQRKYILGTVLVELDFFKGRRICYDKAQASSFGMTPIFALLKNHLQKILRFEGKKKTSNNTPETSSVHLLSTV